MITLHKSSLYYKHLIIALYLGAFEMILRGLGQFNEIIESLAIAVIQGWIYVLPLILLIIYPIRGEKYLRFNSVLVLIQILYLVFFIAPATIDNGYLSVLLKGVKNYYLPLVIYFIIIDYLLANYDGFEEKFLSHIFRLGIIFGVFIVIEVFLLYFMPHSSFLSLLRFISFNFKGRAESILGFGIRPIGLYHSNHYSGMLFAILSVFCLHVKRKFCGFKTKHLFYFFLFCLLISTSKTYTFAFVLYFILVALLSFDMNKYMVIFCSVVVMLAFIMVNQSFYDYYHGILFGDSQTRFRMMDKWSEVGWFLEHSVVPNGFIPEVANPEDAPMYIPFEFYDGEVYAYKLMYQIGIFGAFMWIYTVWRPLFTFRIVKMILNPYGGVLFVSICGLIHYLTVHPIFIFSIVVYSQIMILRNRHSRLEAKCEVNGCKEGNLSGGKELK